MAEAPTQPGKAPPWHALYLDRHGPLIVGLESGPGGWSFECAPNDLLPDIAYQEYVVGGHLIDDAAVVSQLTTVFSELRNQALGPDESLAMIAQLAEHQRE